ncbi:MAG TPA: hypothetical protein DCL66_02570 [Gammaproteobacteria bacterium]|nr:hypothetical protein [Gammaproteobacteria bacterium]
MNAPALAQQTPGAKINTDGMGFSRVAQGTRAAYDLVAAYDEHAIVEANCSTVKADVKGVSW